MSGEKDEASGMMAEDNLKYRGNKSSTISKSRIIFIVLVVIAVVVLIIGIVLIALASKKKGCDDHEKERKHPRRPGEQTLTSFCEYSEEAKFFFFNED